MNKLKNLGKVVFVLSFIAAAMLFLLVILPGHFGTVNSQSGWGAVNNQASLNGTNLTYYRGTTAARCQSDCGGNSNCKGFTLIRAGAYNPNDPPMCYLLSKVTAVVTHSCCISAVKTGGGGASATAIDWAKQADDLRGKNGERFSFGCRANGAASGRIWGTGIYTDDTSICTAAVHAGLITAASGGTITIEIRSGQQSYTGSSRNGITSNSYGSFYGSFVFVR